MKPDIEAIRFRCRKAMEAAGDPGYREPFTCDLHEEIAGLNSDLSALRAENDSLKEKLAGITEKSDELYRQWLALDRHGDNSFGTWRARAEAAEAKVARLAEALKVSECRCYRIIEGHGDLVECRRCASLRETEGPAAPAVPVTPEHKCEPYDEGCCCYQLADEPSEDCVKHGGAVRKPRCSCGKFCPPPQKPEEGGAR